MGSFREGPDERIVDRDHEADAVCAVLCGWFAICGEATPRVETSRRPEQARVWVDGQPNTRPGTHPEVNREAGTRAGVQWHASGIGPAAADRCTYRCLNPGIDLTDATDALSSMVCLPENRVLLPLVLSRDTSNAKRQWDSPIQGATLSFLVAEPERPM